MGASRGRQPGRHCGGGEGSRPLLARYEGAGHRGLDVWDTAVPDATAYCASKFGVVGFTRALTAELRGDVGVTMLTPGGMRTAFFDDRDERYKPPAELELCDPRHVADAVMFAHAATGCEVRELVVTPPDETSWP